MKKYIVTAVEKMPAGVSLQLECEDGGTGYLISEETYRTLAYEEGRELTEEEAAFLESEAEYLRAVARTLKILSYSSNSKASLVRKLCHYGFERDVALRAAASAEADGTLDENRQASHLCDYYVRHKYWGKKRIAAELMCRGYEKEAVMFALSSVEEERFAHNLMLLVENKPVPEDAAKRDRYIAAIARMGYSVSEIIKAIESL